MLEHFLARIGRAPDGNLLHVLQSVVQALSQNVVQVDDVIRMQVGDEHDAESFRLERRDAVASRGRGAADNSRAGIDQVRTLSTHDGHAGT